MGPKLYCLFLGGLLFVNLTDDLCAVVCPSVVPDDSVGLTEPTVLLSIAPRKEFIDRIETPAPACPAWAVSCGARFLGQDLVETAAFLPHPSLYALMSFQC
jgi:hypothetical protein